MICKKCLQFGHLKKYCTRNKSYCNTCAEPINEREEENNHTCRGECCLYCNKEHKTGDKQKCEEYKKETEIQNKMAEQKCDIFEAKNLENQMREIIRSNSKGKERRKHQKEPEEGKGNKCNKERIRRKRHRNNKKTEKNTNMDPPPCRAIKKKIKTPKHKRQRK